MPKISIIIPVYKVEKYLRRCLDSLVAQTFTDWECILVDDGSPDNSGAICDEYAEKDGRFRVFHQENAGVSAARNKALDEAKGEWIGFVDSDDWIDAETYEVAYNRAVKEGADLIQWGYVHELSSKSLYRPSQEKIFTYEDSNIYWEPSMWNKLISAKLILDNNIIFPEGTKLSEDRLFAFKCYIKAKKCVAIENCFYHYRSNETSASHSITKDMIMQEIEVVKEMERLAAGKMDDYLLTQKKECKIHILLLMDPTDLNFFRHCFAEINKKIIFDANKKHAFLSFLTLIHLDFLVHFILYIWKVCKK